MAEGVPSCDLHNSHKSMDDEYLMFFLATHFVGNEHKVSHFNSKVKRAIERKPSTFQGFIKINRPVNLANPVTEERQSTIAYVVDMARLNNIFTHIANGIYFHHKKEKWHGNVKIFIPMLTVLDVKNCVATNESIQRDGDALNEVFSSATRYGENSEVFQFSMMSGPENKHMIYRVKCSGL